MDHDDLREPETAGEDIPQLNNDVRRQRPLATNIDKRLQSHLISHILLHLNSSLVRILLMSECELSTRQFQDNISSMSSRSGVRVLHNGAPFL